VERKVSVLEVVLTRLIVALAASPSMRLEYMSRNHDR
jgi:hypothetical protein